MNFRAFLLAAAAAWAFSGDGVTSRFDQSRNTAQGPTRLTVVDLSDPPQLAAFDKFEASFRVEGSVSTNFQFPYDPAPPAGIDPKLEAFNGINVDALFTPDGWRTVYRQPGFFYRKWVDGGLKPEAGGRARAWRYPGEAGEWKIRFTPNKAGDWQYALAVADASGSIRTAPRHFTVTPAERRGFIHVGKRDPRYFEFDDGGPFVGIGVNLPGLDVAEANALRQSRIGFVRTWISSLYGSAWLRWRGRRNLYDGYLPRAGILPIHGEAGDRMALRLSYPSAWFDDAYTDSGDLPEAVKRNAAYAVSIRYRGESLRASPARAPSAADSGLVVRIGGMLVAGTPEPLQGWGTLSGVWYSGNHTFLPPLTLSLENVTEGIADITTVSVRELLPHGARGPEILEESSMAFDQYFHERSLREIDDMVELAETSDIYLKLVLLEKNDVVFSKLNADGSYVIDGKRDNPAGFYGTGRGANRTRWLQQAWWRYVIARWGYSPHIHSWELTNEGDPYNPRHWEMADEFGRFMKCRVYGAAVKNDEAGTCLGEHPNAHLVTTSFWSGFPGYSPKTRQGFWGSRVYSNLDYADVHAYIPTSPAPEPDKAAMEKDTAYYHLWHSQTYASWGLRMPVVRGEAGLTPRASSTDDYAGLGLQRDTGGVWFHNLLWAGLDSGALYELYWFTHPHIRDAGRYDHYHLALPFATFMAGIPVNNGRYQDLRAHVSGAGLRVVGQKDVTGGMAHLWIQNLHHTWKNIVDRVELAPASGVIAIEGFAPRTTYSLEWWDTYAPGRKRSGNPFVTADALGAIAIPVSNLQSDVALKIFPTPTR